MHEYVPDKNFYRGLLVMLLCSTPLWLAILMLVWWSLS
jgi:hypothetical protein